MPESIRGGCDVTSTKSNFEFPLKRKYLNETRTYSCGICCWVVLCSTLSVFHVRLLFRYGGFSLVTVILSHLLWVKGFKKHLKLAKVLYLFQDLSGKWAQSCWYVGVTVGQSDHVAAYCLGLLHTKPSLVFSELVSAKTELLCIFSIWKCTSCIWSMAVILSLISYTVSI